MFYVFPKSGLPTGGQRFRPVDRIEYLFHFAKDVNKIKLYSDRIREPYAKSTISRMKYDIGIHDVIDENGKTITQKRKMIPNPLGKMPDNVFRFQTNGINRDNNVKHPAAFNTELSDYFVKWLTDEGDLILDPFMGSGTTAISCKKMNRNYIGIEKNKKYVEMAEKRILSYKSNVMEKNKFYE